MGKRKFSKAFQRFDYARRNIKKTFRSATARGSNRLTLGQKLQSYPTPLTTHHDRGTIYTRKRMPYRKKKAWKSFTRKVQHVIQKVTGSKSFVMTRQTNGANAINKQAYTNIHTFMGLSGSPSAESAMADVSQLFDLSVQYGFTTQKTASKLCVTGILCETQVHNIGADDCWLDCYYWKCIKPVTSVLSSFAGLWIDSLADTKDMYPPLGSGLSPNDYGVTPFQAGAQFPKCVRIWKKTRQLLGPGSTVQVETRSAKNYIRSYAHDEDYCMDRCTEGILFMWYGVPTVAAPTASIATLAFSTNVNYTFHVVSQAEYHTGTNVV